MKVLTLEQSKAITQLVTSETPNILKTNFGVISALFQDAELLDHLVSVSLDRLQQFDDQLFFLDTSDQKRIRYNFERQLEKTFFYGYAEIVKHGFNAWIQGSYIWVNTNQERNKDLENVGLSRCNKSDSPNYGFYYFSQFGKRMYNTGQTRQTITRKIHRV